MRKRNSPASSSNNARLYSLKIGNRHRNSDAAKEVQSLVKNFVLSKSDYCRIMDVITRECDAGLKTQRKPSEKRHGLPMICSHVTKLPTGRERGDYVALDFGGTNFRVVGVSLSGKAADLKIQEISHRLPLYIRTCKFEQLFDYIAECTEKAMKSWATDLHKTVPIGFTFSFPCRHDSLRDAVSLALTKEFNVEGLIGKNVSDCLEDALHSKGLNFKCIATVNDTVSTLSACRFLDQNCRIGVVVGTGTNAAYIDDYSNVPACKNKQGQVIINTEWAHAGDSGSLESFRNDIDRELDSCSTNPGLAKMEKMTSGLYLGELARLAMNIFVKNGQLFEGKMPEFLSKKDSFPTRYLSEVSLDPPGLYYSTERVLLYQLQLVSISHMDMMIVRALCEAIIDRSAGIIGAGIASLLTRIGGDCITVGVDGSLFKFHPNFANLLTRHITQLLPKRNFKLQLSEDGSGKGVALIAAAAAAAAS